MEEGKGARMGYELVLLVWFTWWFLLCCRMRHLGGDIDTQWAMRWTGETGAFHSTSGEAVGSFGTCILYDLAL